MTSHFVALAVAALVAGALIPVQAAANAQLSKSLDSVIYAALVLFLVGFLTILASLMFRGSPIPDRQSFTMASWTSYIGGVIVACYVLSITYLAPRLGVGTAISFIVSGQIIAAVVIDHFGFLGAPVTSINSKRLLGVCLIVSGVFLARF